MYESFGPLLSVVGWLLVWSTSWSMLCCAELWEWTNDANMPVIFLLFACTCATISQNVSPSTRFARFASSSNVKSWMIFFWTDGSKLNRISKSMVWMNTNVNCDLHSCCWFFGEMIFIHQFGSLLDIIWQQVYDSTSCIRKIRFITIWKNVNYVC